MEHTPRRPRRLFEENKLRCPRCKQLQDVLAYVPFVQVPEFATQTVQVLKCTNCRWIFAPKPDPPGMVPGLDDPDEAVGEQPAAEVRELRRAETA